MHKFALEPKGSYELSTDSSGAGVPDSKDPTTIFDCFPRPVVSRKSAEDRMRVVNDTGFPDGVVSPLIGGQ
jgi:hypothetical protein